MRNRKSRTQHKARPRRASTPSTPNDYLEAKRQYLKRQRLRQRQSSRKGDNHDQPPKARRVQMLTVAAVKAKRERWAAIAGETQEIVLGDGQYVEERRVSLISPAVAQSTGQGPDQVACMDPAIFRTAYNISVQVQLSRQSTTFYPHYSELLASWLRTRLGTKQTAEQTVIEFTHNSTLTAARRLVYSIPDLCAHNLLSRLRTRLGVLSFASPKRPGGGFLNGGDEQEEVIARLSSLVASLGAPAAQDFYKEHKKYKVEDGSGLHDHSMVYSPDIVVFRKDADDTLAIIDGDPSSPPDTVGGDFIPPYTINVVSSVPVNAAAVHAKHVILPSEAQFFEDGIRSAMKERMARALRLFEEQGDRVLVLGAFGCGSSQNKAETVASVWAELLVCGDEEGPDGTRREARFKNVFEKVVFAVPGKLFEPFRKAFEMRIFETQVAQAAISDDA